MVFLGREAAACPRRVFVGNRFEWDRRFAFQANASRPTEIGPLGDAGVQAVRDAGQVFDDRVPAVYRAALPAVLTEGQQRACAIFDGIGGLQTYHVAEQAFTRDIFV